MSLPQSFMNLSGPAVREIKDYHRVSDRNLMVVHDDLDLPLGRIKTAFDSGAAGHRGVDSIIGQLGTRQFHRTRIGIGRPISQEEVEDFVLSPFEKKDQELVEESVAEAVKILKKWICEEVS